MLLLTGCGGGDLGQVTGTITLDNQPLADATVQFEPIQGGRWSAARTDASGKYELVYTRQQMGAEFGEHLVKITTAQELVDGDNVTEVAERVPAKYNASSELRATVKEGKQVIDFPLDSQGEIATNPEG